MVTLAVPVVVEEVGQVLPERVVRLPAQIPTPVAQVEHQHAQVVVVVVRPRQALLRLGALPAVRVRRLLILTPT
jgi:hypothetical protein